MITDKQCKTLVGNLKGLDGWPETTWQRAQLGLAIMRHCPTVEHAERTLEACLQERRFCPTADQISAIAKSLPRDTDASRRRSQCSACNGTGFAVVESHVDAEGHTVGQGTAARCRCRTAV